MKKGFTVIELLAVIIILGIIALMSVPIIINIIEDSKKGAFKASVQNLFSAYETYELKNIFVMEENGKISIVDLPLTNKGNFISGKIYKEKSVVKVVDVSNGVYCANGTLETLQIIEGSCDILDTTPPVIENIVSEVTTNSITIYTTYKEEESFLEKHEYRIASFNEDIEEKKWENGDTLTGNLSTKIYTGLTLNTTYKIQVRLMNTSLENKESEIKEIIVTTDSIEKPVIKILTIEEYTTNKKVEIIYPTKEGFVYEYSFNNITWYPYENILTVEENGTLRARIYDGTNYIYADNLTISGIDKTEPIVTIKESIVDNKTVLTASVEPKSTISGYYYSWYKEGNILSKEITQTIISPEPGSYKVKVTTGAGKETESNEVKKRYMAQELLQNVSSVMDEDPNQNLRYVGKNPNNYVSFNNELWRIIGVFSGQAKLIRNDFYSEDIEWDKTEANGGHEDYGINDWSKATLQVELNEIYLQSIEETSKSYIDQEHEWNLGGTDTTSNHLQHQTRNNLYNDERNNVVFESHPTKWRGAIGLMYASDYGYATSSMDSCKEKPLSTWEWTENMECYNNNWISPSNEWTLTVSNDTQVNYYALFFSEKSVDYLDYGFVSTRFKVRPTLYLKMDVKIIGGVGTSSNPYLLGI